MRKLALLGAVVWRKLALLGAIVCLVSCYGTNAFSQTVPHYLGPSAGKADGANAGRSGMNAMCRNTWGATYGVTVHMCTVDEFFLAAVPPAATSRVLWVQPAVHNCIDAATCTETGATAVVPQSNLFLSCSEWTDGSAATDGTSVSYSSTSGAGWTLQTGVACNESNYVACCYP